MTSPGDEFNRWAPLDNRTFGVAAHVTSGNFAILLVDVLLSTAALAGNLVFFHVLRTTRCLHSNLRVLLLNSALSNAVFAVARFMMSVPLVIAFLTNVDVSGKPLCAVGRNLYQSAAFVDGCSFFAMMIERSVASITFRTYESRHYCHFGYLIALFQWALAALVAVINRIDWAYSVHQASTGLDCQEEQMTGRILAATVFAFLIVDLLALVGFVLIFRFNSRQYHNKEAHNLGESYQIAENIRSTRMLFPLMGILFTGTCLGMAILGVSSVLIVVSQEFAPKERIAFLTFYLGRGGEFMHLYDLVAGASKVAFCYGMFTHPLLLRRLHVFCFSFRPTDIRPQNLETLRALDGTNMTFSTREETEHHFVSLRQMWQ